MSPLWSRNQASAKARQKLLHNKKLKSKERRKEKKRAESEKRRRIKMDGVAEWAERRTQDPMDSMIRVQTPPGAQIDR